MELQPTPRVMRPGGGTNWGSRDMAKKAAMRKGGRVNMDTIGICRCGHPFIGHLGPLKSTSIPPTTGPCRSCPGRMCPGWVENAVVKPNAANTGNVLARFTEPRIVLSKPESQLPTVVDVLPVEQRAALMMAASPTTGKQIAGWRFGLPLIKTNEVETMKTKTETEVKHSNRWCETCGKDVPSGTWMRKHMATLHQLGVPQPIDGHDGKLKLEAKTHVPVPTAKPLVRPKKKAAWQNPVTCDCGRVFARANEYGNHRKVCAAERTSVPPTHVVNEAILGKASRKGTVRHLQVIAQMRGSTTGKGHIAKPMLVTAHRHEEPRERNGKWVSFPQLGVRVRIEVQALRRAKGITTKQANTLARLLKSLA